MATPSSSNIPVGPIDVTGVDDFDAAVLGHGLPPAAEQALREAGLLRHDPPAEMAALMRAQALAPEHPAVAIAFYRFHFYGHRLPAARGVARQALVIGARALGLPTVWREVPDVALPHALDHAPTRFYLWVLKGYAYLSLRLGDGDEARDALAKLRALDPGDVVGGALLEALRQRQLRRQQLAADGSDGEDSDEDDGPALTSFGAAAWARVDAIDRAMSSRDAAPGPAATPVELAAPAHAADAPVDPEWNDIVALHWQGGPLDCPACPHATLRATGGCEPGRSCMQDAYARRIDRFFRSHRELAHRHLDHGYFEVRAIAARYADVFHLPALMKDPDETVRLQIALRLPQRLLLEMRSDPHREVRIRVALRLATEHLASMVNDSDYQVRAIVAQRLPEALLPLLIDDADVQVRGEVAHRLAMPALWRLAADAAPEVRRIVAERLPPPLLAVFAGDPDLLVRWQAAGRADVDLLRRFSHDAEADIRERAEQRLAELAADHPASEPMPLADASPQTSHEPSKDRSPGPWPATLHPV
ncbi:MAG: hypothetical protein RL375_1607 [Pseudomonadota bacterium]